VRKSLESWLQYIQTLRPLEEDLNLERVKSVYRKLATDSLADKIVIVGGTNGKGTTVEYLNELAIANNLQVGAYTSPHLFNFNERIRVNGKTVSDLEIISAFEEIEDLREGTNLTYFDYATLAAFFIFEKHELDLVILEVGIGGRFDPVNIIEPDVSILTSVDLDHQNWLGNSKEEIGAEKAAIFRKNKPAILGQIDLPEVVFSEAKRIGSDVVELNREFKVFNVSNNKWSYLFNYKEVKIEFNDLDHNNLSIEAASAALTAFFLLGYQDKGLIRGALNKTKLKGRCDLVSNKFLLDVSHNPASVKQLTSYLRNNFKNRQKITAIFGVMQDKDVLEIILSIKDLVSRWVAVSPDIERAMPSNELSLLLKGAVKEEVYTEESVRKAIENIPDLKEDELVLVFGSFYTISEAFEAIKELGI